MIEYIAGDTIKQAATLYINKAANELFPIPTDGSATIQAYITDSKRQKVIVSAVTIAHTDANNDWPNGALYFEFDAANTGVLAEHDSDEIVVAVRVTINSKPKTFKQRVKAVKMPLNIV